MTWPQPSPWFGRTERNPAARAILFCFPFSGGGASVYNAWRRMFPPEIEVSPVHLPGREERIDEPREVSPEVIAQVMAQRIDLPFAIYGHSMGARLGFEVLKRLRDLGVRDPVRFYAAACPSPEVTDTVAQCVTLPDEQFIARLIRRLGAPEELRDVSELRDLLLPILRYDMEWSHRYRYQPSTPLATTIVALAGEADTEATPGTMAGWSRQGQRSRLLTIPGGHFFIKTASSELAALVAEDLLGALAEHAPATRSRTS
jgi:surfactin synthase thioesterase subunit